VESWQSWFDLRSAISRIVGWIRAHPNLYVRSGAANRSSFVLFTGLVVAGLWGLFLLKEVMMQTRKLLLTCWLGSWTDSNQVRPVVHRFLYRVVDDRISQYVESVCADPPRWSHLVIVIRLNTLNGEGPGVEGLPPQNTKQAHDTRGE
jgi:hypothetical protein